MPATLRRAEACLRLNERDFPLTIILPRRRRRPQTAPATGPDPVDIHVGARVKLRRILVGLSQSQLGEAIGLTFQQIQKYERAGNRISASMLYHIAQVLDVPVSFFFDDMADGQRLPVAQPDDTMTRSESVELIRHYYGIPEGVRRQIHHLVKAMAQHDV